MIPRIGRHLYGADRQPIRSADVRVANAAPVFLLNSSAVYAHHERENGRSI
jgi:hypothetical protein